jgi:hypothetical protein
MLMMLNCWGIISAMKRDVEVIIDAIKKVGLDVNRRRTKQAYMLMSHENMAEFQHFGKMITK